MLKELTTQRDIRCLLESHFKATNHIIARCILPKVRHFVVTLSGDDKQCEVIVVFEKKQHKEAIGLTCDSDDRAGAERYIRQLFRRAFRQLLNEDAVSLYHYRVIVLPPEKKDTGHEVGLNNCFFKTNKTRTYDELRFRSGPEIDLYKELRQRKIMFCPNPAAILGGEDYLKREPDFLICQNGKFGILEVMGPDYHTGANAAKDHDRARLFNDYGINCILFYDADRCSKRPAEVVDDFLKRMARS